MMHRWNEFLKEGDALYSYMIDNIDNMFDGEIIIKHFEIRDEYYNNVNYGKLISENYSSDIQKELIKWIKKEHEENRLFNKTLWKPFRDSYSLSEMYYGYRKLFQYKHYYFQLAMESECIINNCKYCITKKVCNTTKIILNQHFVLALYGWKEDNSDMLYPYKDSIIPIDCMMPEKYWILQ